MTEIIHNVHLKVTQVITPIALTATTIFSGEKDFLSNRVLDDILVISFEAGKHYVV